MPKMFPSQQFMSEGNRRGNTVGEQDHARGVPPSRPLGPTRVAVDDSAARHALLRANFNQRVGLLDTRIGRRSVPPDKGDAVDDAVNRSTVA